LDQCCLVIWSHVTLWILASYWRIIYSFTQKVSLFFLFDISKICMFVYQEVWWHSMFFLQTRLYVWLGLLKITGWEFLWGSVQSSPTVDCWFYGTKVSPSTNFCWVHQYEFELVQHCLLGAIGMNCFQTLIYLFFRLLFFSQASTQMFMASKQISLSLTLRVRCSQPYDLSCVLCLVIMNILIYDWVDICSGEQISRRNGKQL